MPSTLPQIVEEIRKIGSAYTDQFRGWKVFKKAFHNELHRDIAKELALYTSPDNKTEQASRREIKDYLLFQYLRLKNFKGDLAFSIGNCLKEHFKAPIDVIENLIGASCEINQAYLIKNIPNQLLSHYLGVVTTSESIRTNNIEKIKKLKTLIASEPMPTKSDTEARWNALLDIYAMLPSNDVVLAEEIRRPIQNVFKITMKLEAQEYGSGTMIAFEIHPARTASLARNEIYRIIDKKLKINLLKEIIHDEPEEKVESPCRAAV